MDKVMSEARVQRRQRETERETKRDDTHDYGFAEETRRRVQTQARTFSPAAMRDDRATHNS